MMSTNDAKAISRATFEDNKKDVAFVDHASSPVLSTKSILEIHDDISLGSCREYFEDLPPQVVELTPSSRTTCSYSPRRSTVVLPLQKSLPDLAPPLLDSKVQTTKEKGKEVDLKRPRTVSKPKSPGHQVVVVEPSSSSPHPRRRGSFHSVIATLPSTLGSYSQSGSYSITSNSMPAAMDTSESSLHEDLSPNPLKTELSNNPLPEATSVRDTAAQNDENIRVAVRLRPLETKVELISPQPRPGVSRKSSANAEDPRAWSVESGNTLVQKEGLENSSSSRRSNSRPSSSRLNTFEFDAVFDEDVATNQIYSKWMRPLVDTVLEGRHATVFAYGCTGSGKTHSMQGTEQVERNEDGLGLVQLAAKDLFQRIQNSQVVAEGASREYTVHAQYFEIYNEQIRDLLVDAGHGPPRRLLRSLRGNNASKTRQIQVREDENGNPVLANAQECLVEGVEDVLKLVEGGNKNRAICATGRNKKSSRSHAVFRLTLESHSVASEDDQTTRISVLNMVDLAGSESAIHSGSTGIRRREGGKINQSLLSLSKVIHSLSLPENKRPKHINYRDSKLTRILQPHLSGNASMGVLCCISPSKTNTEETRSTLKFAASASQVVMKPVINEVVDQEKLLAKLQKELAETRATVLSLQSYVGNTSQKTLPTLSTSEETELMASDRVKQGKGNSQTASISTDSSPTTSYINIEPNCTRANHAAASVTEGSTNAFFDEEVPEPLPESMVFRSSEDPPSSTLVPVNEVYFMTESHPQKENTISEEDDNGDIPQLAESEERVKFLEEKLDATDNLVETLFKDLEAERVNNAEMDALNADLERRLQEYEKGCVAEANRDKLALLKYTFYTAVAMYMAGETAADLQLASVVFMWLTMEGNT